MSESFRMYKAKSRAKSAARKYEVVLPCSVGWQKIEVFLPEDKKWWSMQRQRRFALGMAIDLKSKVRVYRLPGGGPDIELHPSEKRR